VATNIEDPSLKIRRIDVPQMPDYDLAQAVKWSFREVIEDSIENYTIRYSHLDEHITGDVKRFSLLVYGLKTEAVKKRVNFLKSLGLVPTVVEPNAVAMLAAFDKGHQWVKGAYHALIYIGWEKSFFVVVAQGKLYFCRPLEKVSVKKCLDGIRKTHQLSSEQFQKIKSMCLQNGENISSVLSSFDNFNEVLANYFHEFSLEIQRSIDSFLVMFHAEKIDTMVVNGCGAFFASNK